MRDAPVLQEKQDHARVSDPSSLWGALWRLVRVHGVRRHGKALILGVGCLIGVALLTALLTTYFKPVFDDLLIQRQKDRLVWVLLGLISAFALKGFCEYGATLSLEHVGQSMTTSLQKALFDHLIFLDLEFFRKRHEGHITSLLMHDTKTLQRAVLHSIQVMVGQILTIVALAFVMLREHTQLALGAFTGFPLVIWLLVSRGRKVRGISLTQSQDTDGLHVFFQQIFQNITLVKACHTQDHESQALSHRLIQVWKHGMQNARVRALISPITEFLGGMAIIAVLWVGGVQVMAGRQSTGSFLTFIAALLLLYRPLKGLSQTHAQLQEGLAAVQRIQAVFDTPRPHEACLGSPLIPPPTSFRKDIVFDGVSFGYGEGADPVFQDFSCHLIGGQRIALVGPSGVGKTTLFSLLLRFYAPLQGRILWGGHDLASIPVQHLRQQISLVSQDIFLFDDTVGANIAYGTAATADEVRHAARMAFADEFIDRLPQGYDTTVGARGIKLSGGQRQRLALARAFLRDTPLLLLDEPTSALDSQSESAIKQATELLTSQRTTLTIAHRLSTIEHADTVVVLDRNAQGLTHIVQQGNPSELMGQEGLYRTLALAQQCS